LQSNTPTVIAAPPASGADCTASTTITGAAVGLPVGLTVVGLTVGFLVGLAVVGGAVTGSLIGISMPPLSFPCMEKYPATFPCMVGCGVAGARVGFLVIGTECKLFSLLAG